MTLENRQTKGLGLFLKKPEPGKVKTRLAKTLGDAFAARVYTAFVSDLFKTLHGLQEVQIFVFFTPDDDQIAVEDFLKSITDKGLREQIQLVPQGEGDLGHRMVRAFKRLEKAVERGVLIGTDFPTLKGSTLEAAWQALDSNDLTLGPALDGGYYLIGMKDSHPELFEGVNWSTESVFSETIQRSENLGLKTVILEEGDDIDDEKDLKNLFQMLRNQPDLAPETLLVIQDIWS